MTLGERIKAAREAKGYSQAKLAHACAVKSAGVISNWENDINKPDIEKLVSLCNALDVTSAYLLDHYPPEDNSLSPDEQDLIRDMRLLGDKGKERVLSVLKEELKIMEQEAKGYVAISPKPIDKPVFLPKEDADYDSMRKQMELLKQLRKEKNIPLENITHFLWAIGYGEDICLGYVIGMFRYGLLVPNLQLYNRMKGYLEGKFRIVMDGEEKC